MVKNYDSVGMQSSLSESDLELINKQSLKKLTEEDVFTFSAKLCDNEIDRDFERFSDESLNALKDLFVGKTGILNHSNRSEDQSCRTYKTELITDEAKLTSYGEPYKYLKAWCYTVKSQKNADLIKDIEGGIKKEVSVSCNFTEKVCSICGESFCNHAVGKFYGDKLCFKTINGVTDAYEWSFVAVPAQRDAGVTKSKKKNTKDLLEEARIKDEKSFVNFFKQELKEEALKGFAVLIPTLKSTVSEDIVNSLSVETLKELNSAFKNQTAKLFPVASQFFGVNQGTNTNENSQFRF